MPFGIWELALAGLRESLEDELNGERSTPKREKNRRREKFSDRALPAESSGRLDEPSRGCAEKT